MFHTEKQVGLWLANVASVSEATQRAAGREFQSTANTVFVRRRSSVRASPDLKFVANSLPTPTAVARYGSHRRLSVCLSVCLSARYLYKKLSYRRETARRDMLVNSYYVSRGMEVIGLNVSISKSDLQGHSRALAMVPFDMLHKPTISY